MFILRVKSDSEKGTAIIEYVLIVTLFVVSMFGMRSALMTTIKDKDANLSKAVSRNYPLPLKTFP